MKRTFSKRSEDEQKEGYDTVKTDLPSSRFQSEKQVLTPDELGVTKSSIPGTASQVTTANIKTAEKVKSKVKIKPEVSVEEMKNTQVGGVPLAASIGMRKVAGASDQSSVDDTSKIPYTKGGYRPSTRYGKKRSEDLFEMDNTISEQIVPQVDDAKDLKDAPNAKQGYNGRKQFKQTRGKKNFKTTVNDRVPQQLLNEASVDFIETDKYIYTSGQIINGVDSQADYPTVRNGGAAVDFQMHKSNYVPRNLKLYIDNGMIEKIEIEEDRFDVPADPISRDQANMNWQVDANNVAKAMIKLQTELGRETTDKWSPLGYVINEPYQYNMLMHDIENETGAMAAIAYRSAVSAMAFQRNILGKDGVNPQRNAVKMILEGYAGDFANTSANVISETDLQKVVFNKKEYAKGSPAAIIEMFDSVNKYSTKADILGLQRSWGLHLSQADNNINPLHCKPNFIKALDKAHMFSTVDGGYNPMLPIHVTKKINVINNVSLNAFLAGWKNPRAFEAADKVYSLRDQTTGTLANYAYQYNDVRNPYLTRVQHPFVEGLVMWLLKHEGKIVNVFGPDSGRGNDPVVIPFDFNFMAPSLLSLIVCSASQYIALQRNIAYRDVLFAGEQSTYIWDDLVGLDKLNPLYSSQLTIGKYDEPLKLGKLAADTAIRELWGTHMNLCDYQDGAGTDTKAQYFAPWYFNEQAVGGTPGFTNNEGFFKEASAFNMSIPSIRDGVRHEYTDLIKGMDERDVRLSLDRWIRFPLRVTATAITATVHINGNTTGLASLWTDHIAESGATAISNQIKASALRYDVNSDGRIVLTYQLENGGTETHLDEYSLLGCPKELGWIEDYYHGNSVITAMSYSGDPHSGTLTLTTTALGNFETHDGCHMYAGYSPMRIVSYRVEGDSNTDYAIDRSAALYQVCYRCFASPQAASINSDYVAKTGIIPAVSYLNGAAKVLNGVFTLDSSNTSSTALDVQIKTYAPLIWSIVQRIFLPVNRFENCYVINKSDTTFDPFESSFYFGLCGFLASDYTQDVLERLDISDQLGLDYTEDVFARDSLLFR